MKRKIIAIFLSISLFAGLLGSLRILAKADVDLSPKAVMNAAFSGNFNAEQVYNMARSTASDCTVIENAAAEEMLCKYAGVLESVVTDGQLNAYSAILSQKLMQKPAISNILKQSRCLR